MKIIKNKIIYINDEKHIFDIQVIENKDRIVLRQIYDLWKKINLKSKNFSRSINLPEIISESAFCLEFNSWRVIKKVKGSRKSYDAISFDTHLRQQIKATSIENDLTSFGTEINWDKLFFLDFFRKGNFDYSFDVYDIPTIMITNAILNKKKGQTFRDQQKQGRRPRFCLKKKLLNLILLNL